MLGRKKMFFIFYLAAAASIMAAFGLDLAPHTRLYFYFPIGLSVFGIFGSFTFYLPELFPTRVRATGQGLAFNFGRILAAAGAWQMGALMGFFGKSYARAGETISLVYLVGMALIWLAPETRGKPLPE